MYTDTEICLPEIEMNGVDSEELIAAQVGAEHLLYSFIKVASHKEADGYHFDPDATLGVIYGVVPNVK